MINVVLLFVQWRLEQLWCGLFISFLAFLNDLRGHYLLINGLAKSFLFHAIIILLTPKLRRDALALVKPRFTSLILILRQNLILLQNHAVYGGYVRISEHLLLNKRMIDLVLLISISRPQVINFAVNYDALLRYRRNTAWSDNWLLYLLFQNFTVVLLHRKSCSNWIHKATCAESLEGVWSGHFRHFRRWDSLLI